MTSIGARFGRWWEGSGPEPGWLLVGSIVALVASVAVLAVVIAGVILW